MADEQHLHTVQEKLQILTEAEKAGNTTKELEDLTTAFAIYKTDSDSAISHLKAELDATRAILASDRVLDAVSLAEILKELIKRLRNILDIRKRG